MSQNEEKNEGWSSKSIDSDEDSTQHAQDLIEQLEIKLSEIESIIIGPNPEFSNFQQVKTVLAQNTDGIKRLDADISEIYKEIIDIKKLIESRVDSTQVKQPKYSDTDKQFESEQQTHRVRSVTRQSGPSTSLGGFRYEPARAKFNIKTQLEPETLKERINEQKLRHSQPSMSTGIITQDNTVSLTTEPVETVQAKESNPANLTQVKVKKVVEPDNIYITTNPINHVGNEPKDQLVVNVELNGKRKTFKLDKRTTSTELRKLIKQAMNLEESDELNLLFVTHRAIIDDDKTLWSLGMRNIPNYTTVIPENISIGDQTKLKFISKGNNVNGTYDGYFAQQRRQP